MLDLRQALVRHPIARRLPQSFDAQGLREDLSSVEEGWWRAHLGPYHNGGWESVSLWSPRGDLFEQRSTGGTLSGTPALPRCPRLRSALDSLPGERNRARLMRLRPGARIFRHSDPLERIARDLLRIHIPVTTSPDVTFRVNGRRIEMRPGEVWNIDVRFPHEVWNLGQEHRIHLVVDVRPAPELIALVSRSEVVARGWLTLYFLKHSLPRGVVRRLAIGN